MPNSYHRDELLNPTSISNKGLDKSHWRSFHRTRALLKIVTVKGRHLTEEFRFLKIIPQKFQNDSIFL